MVDKLCLLRDCEAGPTGKSRIWIPDTPRKNLPLCSSACKINVSEDCRGKLKSSDQQCCTSEYKNLQLWNSKLFLLASEPFGWGVPVWRWQWLHGFPSILQQEGSRQTKRAGKVFDGWSLLATCFISELVALLFFLLFAQFITLSYVCHTNSHPKEYLIKPFDFLVEHFYFWHVEICF